LAKHTAQISASHPSLICRAVSSAIDSVQLAAFQQKILEVEDSILRKDAGLVGAYNIVPLTAIIGEFSGWKRRLEWLWDLVQFIAKKLDSQRLCTGAGLMNRLRSEMHTAFSAFATNTAQNMEGE
ncbi:hypothetical protein, partial [Erythrobacter sp. YJ-T3-07]|uniref:hypothetical protein n=1 Tax=Erythrobacter sp. YJ-T3-07 TaxID=2793063 RepID=UPI001F3FA6D8